MDQPHILLPPTRVSETYGDLIVADPGTDDLTDRGTGEALILALIPERTLHNHPNDGETEQPISDRHQDETPRRPGNVDSDAVGGKLLRPTLIGLLT